MGQSVREPLVSFENEYLSFLGRAPGSLRGSLVTLNVYCAITLVWAIETWLCLFGRKRVTVEAWEWVPLRKFQLGHERLSLLELGHRRSQAGDGFATLVCSS